MKSRPQSDQPAGSLTGESRRWFSSISTALAVGIVTMVLGSSVGCDKTSFSGITQSLGSEKLISYAGKAQGVSAASQYSGSGSGGEFVDAERRVIVSTSSGTRGQLMAAYRKEVERVIRSAGATVQGRGIVGPVDDVQDFSFDYHWNHNIGLVRVYSFIGADNKIEIVLYCRESPGS